MDGESTDLIGLGPRSHLRALERLWLLYRAPHQFWLWLARESPGRQIAQTSLLMLHVVPYTIGIRVALAYGIWKHINNGVPPDPSALAFGVTLRIVAVIGIGVIGGVATGIALAIVDRPASFSVRAARFSVGLGFGLANGIAFGIINGAVGDFAGAIFGEIQFEKGMATAFMLTVTVVAWVFVVIATSVTIGLPIAFSGKPLMGKRLLITVTVCMSIGLPLVLLWKGATIGIAIAFGLGFVCSWGIISSRAFYVVPHLAFVLPELHGSWYQWHPVAWDHVCLIPFPRFDLLLTNYFESHPMEAEAEIERLISTYPSQRSSALKARCRIVARKSGKVAALTELAKLVSQLPRGDQRFLAQVPDVAVRVLGITALQEGLVKLPANMPAYRLRQAELVCEAIVSFRDQIAGFAEPLASEFRTAAEHWLKLANGQLDEARHAADREPFPQVFRAGDPVQGEKAEAFIPRQHIIQELAGLILATNGCPGILLYARRRMGKSTCLQNLMGFIPTNIDIVFLNLQDPANCGSLSLFCEQLTKAIRKKLTTSGLSQPSASSGSNDVVDFSRFLDDANTQFGQANRKLLIALDEFESLDIKLGQRDEAGRPLIPEYLLAMFRTSIQSHRNLIWLFSGSHRIAELKHAEWPSYLISVRTLELDRFTLEETSQLLTDPLAHSQLFRGTPNRPKFPPEFWGTDGLRRLHEAADGWPHLVVLLAETCVNLVNSQNAASVTDELFLDVRRKAIVSGDNVMIQLLKNESEIPGEWDFLLGFRDHDVLAAPENIAIGKSLLRRSLVTLEGYLVRLRVPLMHQWIKERSELLD